MSYMRVIQLPTIEVPDHKSLLAAWHSCGLPVRRFIVAKPLTQSQFARLPKALKDLL
jgi:hypothetical protein